ncbi:MAG: hypothetical protein ACXAAQ_03625 [Candidatus Thorarchaeota archaeon]|jgi:hypothetical protein
MVVSLTTAILLFSAIPLIAADSVVILDLNEEALVPTVFGNTTAHESESTMGIAVADDGSMFTINYHSRWEMAKCSTPVSLIAWGDDGIIRWSFNTNTFDKIFFDLTVYGSHVYVVGIKGEDIFLGKYTLDGQSILNRTIDLGEEERGLEISVMDDGTIIVAGISWGFEPIPSTEYFLLGLNQTGQVIWDASFEGYPSPKCHSNYVYIRTSHSLQKRNSWGFVDWFVNCNDEGVGGVTDDVVFTINSPHLYPMTEYDITTWSPLTGNQLDSTNLELCDDNQQLFNRSSSGMTLDPDGSLRILMDAKELQSWYLLTISRTLELTQTIKLLNGSWWYVQIDMDDSGNAYIAATSETYGLTVMRFDSEQIASSPSTTSTTATATTTTTGINGYAEMINSQAISIALIGVVIVDIALLAYLKHKWTRRG